MRGPRSPDVPALAELLRQMEALENADAFGPTVLAELAALIPFDHGVFNDIDPVSRRVRFDVHPPGATPPSWTFDTFDSYLPQNPIFTHVNQTRDGTARRLSDFVTQHKLHELPLYREVLAPLEIEYQVAFSIAYRRPRVLAFALSRRHRDFNTDELDTLNLLRPHLTRTYRRLHAIAESHASRLTTTFGLTHRETEILDALVTGMAVDAIAGDLAITEATVRKHLEHVYRKLGVANRAQATALALRITSAPP